jgi:DNA-binding LytR/AlgR family response regulator
MSMKRIYLVEDEPLAFKRLSKLILELEPNWEIVGHADSVESAVAYLSTEAMPDLLFMDIQLADGISFSIFEKVEIKCPVIFTTAYDEYALKAFKVNSIDYLLKPIDADELRLAISKFKERSSNVLPDLTQLLQGIQGTKKYRTRFLLTKGDALIPVEVAEIAFIVAEDKLVFLYQQSGVKSIFPFTLDELSAQLDPRFFFRVNRSIIAQRNAIQKAELHFNGKIKIHLLPTLETEQFVSREKAGAFKEWWGS